MYNIYWYVKSELDTRKDAGGATYSEKTQRCIGANDGEFEKEQRSRMQ